MSDWVEDIKIKIAIIRHIGVSNWVEDIKVKMPVIKNYLQKITVLLANIYVSSSEISCTMF